MCVKNLSGPLHVLDGIMKGLIIPATSCPQVYEELVIDEVGEVGLRFYKYDQFGGKNPTYWPFTAFVPSNFMEDELKEVLESTVEEEALA